MQAGGLWVRLVAMAWICASACGDEGISGGAAGGSAKGMLGQRCTTDSCATGLTCGRDFEVASLCTASCTNNQSCSLVAPGSNAACVTTTSGGLCMLPCVSDSTCSTGSKCAMVGTQTVCRAP